MIPIKAVIILIIILTACSVFEDPTTRLSCYRDFENSSTRAANHSGAHYFSHALRTERHKGGDKTRRRHGLRYRVT